ncbi:MAG TPA: L-lysine 6-transaminase [Ignavibacteria bacterium]|nr:L-lysine 6-transaminase [Ignavibacteria bacterium]
MEVFEKDKIDLDTGKISENGFKDVKIKPQHVQDVLRERMLVDGFDVTVDLEKSQGSYLYDSKHNRKLLDFFTFVASNPIGMNHPRLNNEEFIERIGKVALNKPSLSDIYAHEQAQFVYTFFNIAVPDYFKYAFFIEGGALAVENALKAAFDWKVLKNFKKGYKTEKGHKVIHFKEAFHGRSGYTLSLTNTDPTKTNYYPKFDWPRITNPKMKFPIENHLDDVIKLEEMAISEIKQAIADNKDDIACMILEPIQGEGGDNQFRKEFFVKLREICDENEILLILDEVQTGIALTGKWWAHQHYVQPDLISFGKKTQVCGVLSTGRVDDVEENVFRKPSRINSTWGGNIVDMVRFSEILKIINDENLVENCANMGNYLQKKLVDLTGKYEGITSNARGLGLFCAFDCKDGEMRNKVTSKALENGLMILGCGSQSIRFRPPINVTESQIDEGINILDDVLSKI